MLAVIYNCHVKADIINPEGKSAGIGNQNYAGPVVHTIEDCTLKVLLKEEELAYQYAMKE